MVKVKIDAETETFADAVLESIQQARFGMGRVTKPLQIIARRKRRDVCRVQPAHQVAAGHSPV